MKFNPAEPYNDLLLLPPGTNEVGLNHNGHEGHNEGKGKINHQQPTTSEGYHSQQAHTVCMF
ncbi:MAG: hypothetical protein WD491_11550 [Balneolales bacterium]